MTVTSACLGLWFTLLALQSTPSIEREEDTGGRPPIADPTRLDSTLREALGATAQGSQTPSNAPPRVPPQVRALVSTNAGTGVVWFDRGKERFSVTTGQRVTRSAEESWVVTGVDSVGVALAGTVAGAPIFVSLADLADYQSVPGPVVTEAAEAKDLVLTRLDLRGLQLGEVCRLLTAATGTNVVSSDGAAGKVVSLYLQEVPVREAVEAICDMHQLWYSADSGTRVLRIRTAGEYERRLASLQDERTEYYTLLYPNVLDVGRAIKNLFGDRVLLRATERETEQFRDLSDRFSRFDLLDARTQGFGASLGISAGVGTPNRTYSQGGGLNEGNTYDASGARGLGGELISGRTFPDSASQAGTRNRLESEEIMRLEELLAERENDDAEREVNDVIEGVYRAPIYVTTSRRQNKLIVRTSDSRAHDEIRTLVERLDVPTALVLLEVRILTVDLVDGFNSFFEYQWADNEWAGQFSTGAIELPLAGALGVGGTGVRPTDLVFQYVDEEFGARLQVLERENRVRSVATPVLLTANNEVSRLFVGREVPLNRSFVGGQVVAGDSATVATSGSTGIEFRPVGTTLLVTPSINADRTVTLRIVQESSNADTTASILVPAGDQFSPQTVNVVSSQSVSGTIVAKSDRAVAFGGLVETSSSDVEERVPFLGRIPLLGVLFRRTTKQEDRRELVVIVRPHVLATPTEHEAVSRRLTEALGVELEDLRLRDHEGAAEAAQHYEVFGLGGR
ncbi:MAG: type II secretion system protein GspD [Planctomycetota bacterium]